MVWGARPVLGTTAGALREEWGACEIVKSTIILLKLLPVLITICQVDYLHGSWWPKMEDLREMGIPCYRFLIYIDPQDGQESSLLIPIFSSIWFYTYHTFPKLQVHAASRRVGLGQHWLRSLGSGWTSAIIIFTVTMNTLVLVGFKDVIVNAAHDKELLRRTVGATTLLGTRDP